MKAKAARSVLILVAAMMVEQGYPRGQSHTALNLRLA
jgi:hypothetical protein